MRFTAAILPALAIASPLIEKRDDMSSALTTDLNNIVTALTAVNNTVNTFTIGQNLTLAKALTLESQTSTLGNALKKGISDADASSSLNSTESTAIAKQVLALINPVQTVINNIVDHQSVFQTGFFLGDLSKTTEAILTVQQNLTSTFGSALGPKLSAPYDSVAPQVTAQLVALFTPGLEAYAKCGSKGLCLPAIIFGSGNKD